MSSTQDSTGVHKVRSACASCGNKDFFNLLSYGKVPLAGYFPNELEANSRDELFDLNIMYCDKCKLVQTDSIIDADKLFRDYRYMSSIGLSGHFESVAKLFKDRFELDEDSSVVEIGSNDGVLLHPFKNNGVNAIGFEPAVNISKIAQNKGLDVINDYFNLENAKKYLEKDSVDLFVSNNCFAHIDDIKSIIEGVEYALKPGGHFVIEVSYVRDLIEKIQYDNIYHEHIYYYSLHALRNLFSKFNFSIVDYDLIPIHSGSIRVYFRKHVDDSSAAMPAKVVKFLLDEAELGLTSKEWFSEFSKKCNDHIGMVTRTLRKLRDDGKTVVGYGASGRANMVCNVCDLGPDLINYIVDESPERAGRYIAGKNIPVVPKSVLDETGADYIVIFAWNFADMIIEKLRGNGYKFIVFFPELQIIEK